MEPVLKGFCVKCRAHREMNDPWTITNKRGVPMMQAKCGTCGRKVNTFKVKRPQDTILSDTGKDARKGGLPATTEDVPKVDEDKKVRRRDRALLPGKRKRAERKSAARRALQMPEDEGVQEDDPVRDDQDGP